MSKKIVILNGPNLNMLGQREKEIYGDISLNDIQKSLNQYVVEYNKLNSKKIIVTFFQSNVEGEIVSSIHQAFKENIDFVIINPGAYSHSSIAILDALKILNCKIAEVHLSNTHRRESFRQKKITAMAATFVIEGLGANGYLVALNEYLKNI